MKENKERTRRYTFRKEDSTICQGFFLICSLPHALLYSGSITSIRFCPQNDPNTTRTEITLSLHISQKKNRSYLYVHIYASICPIQVQYKCTHIHVICLHTCTHLYTWQYTNLPTPHTCTHVLLHPKVQTEHPWYEHHKS